MPLRGRILRGVPSSARGQRKAPQLVQNEAGTAGACLAPETAVNVLLACWDFLETGERPPTLSPIESVAFASFMPDMEEAWKRYLQRITAKNSNGDKPTDIGRYHTTSTETEEETETDPLLSNDNRESGADKPPKRPRFVPPTVAEVRTYCQERGNQVDPAAFVDYYEARGWNLGRGQPMKSWRAAVNTWERRERKQEGGQANELPFL